MFKIDKKKQKIREKINLSSQVVYAIVTMVALSRFSCNITYLKIWRLNLYALGVISLRLCYIMNHLPSVLMWIEL